MPSPLLILGGLAALIAGAEVLVRGGAGLAAWLGIRPMLIGLTVVSVGTSAPELAVGIDAAVTGSPALAVGNIVGTNLVNLLLILGLSALLVPIVFRRATLRLDLPVMTAAALLLYLLSLDGALGRVDGVVLLAGGAAYTGVLWRVSRRETAEQAVDPAAAAEAMPDEEAAATPAVHRPARSAVELVAGLAVIVLGAELLVEGSVRAAQALGVSEAVIGLTVVAIGTSAPELVTTVLSTLRGNRDIALGNLLGSSIYNIGLVLGLTVVVAPEGVPVPDEVLAGDLVLLVAAAVVAVPVFVSGSRMIRAEGALFVAGYLGYLAWLLTART